MIKNYRYNLKNYNNEIIKYKIIQTKQKNVLKLILESHKNINITSDYNKDRYKILIK